MIQQLRADAHANVFSSSLPLSLILFSPLGYNLNGGLCILENKKESEDSDGTFPRLYFFSLSCLQFEGVRLEWVLKISIGKERERNSEKGR